MVNIHEKQQSYLLHIKAAQKNSFVLHNFKMSETSGKPHTNLFC